MVGERYAASLRGYRSELVSEAPSGRTAAGTGDGTTSQREEPVGDAPDAAVPVLRLELEGGGGTLAWSQSGSLRLRVAPGELPAGPELFVERAAWPPLRPHVRESPTGGFALVAPTQRTRVEVEAKPFRLRWLDRSDDPILDLGELHWSDAERTRISLGLGPDDAVYGLADAGAGGNLRGTRCDLGLDAAEGAPRFAVPFVWILRGEADGYRSCGVLVDGFAGCRFDVGATHADALAIEAGAEGVDLLLLPGPTPTDVLRQLAERVGSCPLPPRWALGNQLLCSLREAQRLDRRPLDLPPAAVHLRAADPKRSAESASPPASELAAGFARRGIHTVAEVPCSVRVDPMDPRYRDGLAESAFARSEDGAPFVEGRRSGRRVVPDLNHPSVQRWWTRQHRPLLSSGVDGLWTRAALPATESRRSEGPRFVDPAAPETRRAEATRSRLPSHQHVRAARSVIESERPGERCFTLASRGGVGTQRLAAVLAPGGPARWETLEGLVPQLLGLSTSGLSLCGAEIGGESGRCPPELYARWVQLGALQPFARARLGSEPRGRGTARFGQIVRRAWDLRQRLLPYLEACVRASGASGTPIWRPLAFAFPEDPGSRNIADQFLLGPALLVAPVVARGARTREVYLPPGTWFDWHDDALYRGPRRLQVAAPLDRIPLFVGAGAVLPTWNEHRGPRLEVFPGGDRQFAWVEDDGLRDDAASRSEVRVRLFASVGGRMRLELGRREGRSRAARTLQVRIHACSRAEEVALDGDLLMAGDGVPGWRHQGGRLIVSLRDDGRGAGLEIAPVP